MLPRKLTVPQLVKKFSAFYVTPVFITPYKRACQPSLSSDRSIQSTALCDFLKIQFNIILTPFKNISFFRSDYVIFSVFFQTEAVTRDSNISKKICRNWDTNEISVLPHRDFVAILTKQKLNKCLFKLTFLFKLYM